MDNHKRGTNVLEELSIHIVPGRRVGVVDLGDRPAIHGIGRILHGPLICTLEEGPVLVCQPHTCPRPRVPGDLYLLDLRDRDRVLTSGMAKGQQDTILAELGCAHAPARFDLLKELSMAVVDSLWRVHDRGPNLFSMRCCQSCWDFQVRQ